MSNKTHNFDTKVLTNVRVAYPVLHEPKSFKGGNPRKSALFIVEDKKQIEYLKGIVAEGLKILGVKKLADDKCFLRDGDLKGGDDFEGKMYISCSSAESQILQVINGKKEPVSQGDYGDPESGDYVNIKIQPYTYDTYGNQINCKMSVVQFVRKGDPIGRVETVDDMPDVEDEAPEL